MNMQEKIRALIRIWLSIFQREPKQGLTLRDYFAARALTGILGNSSLRASLGAPTPEECPDIASICYSLADAMIAARTQEGDGK